MGLFCFPKTDTVYVKASLINEVNGYFALKYNIQAVFLAQAVNQTLRVKMSHN